MKKMLFSLLMLPVTIFFSRAATITWIGPSGSNWNNIANWSSGTIPGAADDVIFNLSVTVDMDILPITSPFIYLINSLQVTGNAAVILSRTQAAGGTRILQVKSVSTSIPGLRVDNGSSLTINAGNTMGTLSFVLDLTGDAGVKGQVSGGLYFSGTGPGMGDAYLNVYTSATNYAILTVKSSGVIKYFANTGNTRSAPGTYLAMESGSVYEINKNGGSVPNGNWDDNSTILISGATMNGGIIFSQSQYGNLEWNTPQMSAVTQLIATFSTVNSISLNNLKISNTNGRELRLKTGAASVSPAYDYTVRGKLDITSGGILVITGINVVNAGAGAWLHVMGDLNNAGVLKSEGIAGTVNDLEMNGHINQGISNTGGFSGTQLKFIMNNPAGATLATSLDLPGTTDSTLQLIKGNIKTTSNRLLTMLDNSSYTGGSPASFIEGPVKKIGDGAFIFPIGKGTIYAPAGFSPSGTMDVSDAFQAEYFRLNPQSSFGVNYETPPIDHISYVEYWQLDKTTGSTAIPVNIILSVTPSGFAKDINTLYVARYNPGDLQWKNSGIGARSPGAPSPPYITGSITTTPLTQYGIFALASGEPEGINPLPVDLISFEAKKINSKDVLLTWELANSCATGIRFEIQRSEGGNGFTNIGFLTGIESRTVFDFHDGRPSANLARYRLKITDNNGWMRYSPIITVINDTKGFTISAFAPNPIHDNITAIISSGATIKINFVVHDVSGRIIKQWCQSVIGGISKLTIRSDDFKPGLYTLTGYSGGLVVSRNFVKL